MLKDFQRFLFRGNVLDLAVAVVIGTAFNAVVSALVKDLLTPLISAIIGTPHFANLGFTVRHAHFPVGDFLNAVVSFLVVSAAVFYLVVTPVNLLTHRLAKPQPASAPTTKECLQCCSQIPLKAKRCMYCTSPQT